MTISHPSQEHNLLNPHFFANGMRCIIIVIWFMCELNGAIYLISWKLVDQCVSESSNEVSLSDFLRIAILYERIGKGLSQLGMLV